MKYLRYEINGQIGHGILETDKINILDKPFLEADSRPTNQWVNLNEVKLLAPVLPGKVVCVGLNYMKHIEEMKNELPEKSEDPIIFMKPSTTVIGPEEKIVRPQESQRVDYEGELAVLIGKTLKNASEEEVKTGIFGYTCGNDVTARDLQKRDGQWTRAKSFDTFCPLGPWVETELDPSNLEIRTIVNGEVKQSSRTHYFMTPVYKLVSFMSRVMTLNPGDVVLTGTPEGVGPLELGDEVIVEVEGIGALRNHVE